jgi:glutathione S-transferase
LGSRVIANMPVEYHARLKLDKTKKEVIVDERMILHHYENSPYAEKIRLMFGCTDSHWQSLLSPAWPPRPNVDPLSGGYRRIPIAQIGADIFCDTALIAQEIALATEQPALDPANTTGTARELMLLAEGEGFFSAITSLPTTKLLGTIIRNFGPVGAYRFVKDRSGILKGGTSSPKTGDDAKAVMQGIFSKLEDKLTSELWLGGNAPSAADFAVFHPLWLHLSCNGQLPASATNVHAWYQRIAALGHGERQEITREDAFAVARDTDPRPLPDSEPPSDLKSGQKVSVQPEDYGVVPVIGNLAAITPTRIILARETDAFGTLHVHFPREGYALQAVTD